MSDVGTEYHLVKAGSLEAIEAFDAWPAALKKWERLRKKESVNLIAVWSCGCTHRCIVRGKGNGWRNIKQCDHHADPKNPEALKTYLRATQKTKAIDEPATTA